MSKSDERHKAKEVERIKRRRKRQRLDELRYRRDSEMRMLWERWQARIARERNAL